MAECFSAKKSKAGKEIKCGRCQAIIKPGEMYFYFAVGFRGVKQIRCKDHQPKQSELCGSKMSAAYAANEYLAGSLSAATSIDEIADALESTATDIEQVRDEYQESYDNLPPNFQDGDQGSDIQEKIDGLTEYADTLNEKAQEVRKVESELEPSTDDPDVPEDDPLEVARELAEEVLGEFSL